LNNFIFSKKIMIIFVMKNKYILFLFITLSHLSCIETAGVTANFALH
jgi:hypothetical protein